MRLDEEYIFLCHGCGEERDVLANDLSDAFNSLEGKGWHVDETGATWCPDCKDAPED